MNYQYRNGGGTMAAMNALYEEGGLRRFYRGIQFALVQTPLTRFGDTAANSGVLALLATSDLPISVRTLAASGAASLWRITLTPVDTYKTSLQVVGEGAIEQIDAKVKAGGFGVLYQGALANAASRAGETLSAWSRSGTVSTPVRAFFSGGGGACDASVARYSRHVSTRASIFGAPGVSHSLVSSAPASRAASKHVCHARECQSTWKAHESQHDLARGFAKGACT